jgi:GT2 family glycosyltransferase
VNSAPTPDLSLVVVGAGPFSTPTADPALSIEIVDCAGDGASARRDALGRARGRFVAFVDAGDRLHPEARVTLGPVLAGDRVDVAYTDDDVVDGVDRHSDPFLKPAWSPERLLAQHYTGRLTAIRRPLAIEAAAECTDDGDVFEHDLLLRVTELTDRIEHVARVLYHHRGRRAPVDPATVPARVAVVERALRRRGASLHAAAGPDPDLVRLVAAVSVRPRVSIVIPTAGTTRRVRGEPIPLVLRCVESILTTTEYPDLEIICVTDGSAPAAVREQLHAREGRTESRSFKVVGFHQPFNFSSKINLGASHASGEYLLLLNDDIEVTEPDWIDRLLAFGENPEVGAVGPRLLFEDGRIQHVGVVLAGGHAGHPFYGYGTDTPGYFGAPRVVANYSAVTAACMLTRRAAFEEVGGLATAFPLNYNDVDYCLRLRSRGYRVVYTPDLTLWHYESSSRGIRPPEQHETDLMQARWGPVLRDDPYYSARFVTGGNYLLPVTTDDRAVDDQPLPPSYWLRRWIRDLARVPSSRN